MPVIAYYQLYYYFVRRMKAAKNDDGFYLVWYYWIKKHIQPNKKYHHLTESIDQLISMFRKQYSIETVESNSNQLLEQRISIIKEQTNTITNPLIYVIDPQEQLKSMQQNLKENADLINQLYSYYLNSKNIFIIYKSQSSSDGSAKLESQCSSNDRHNDNISEGHHDTKTSNILSKLRDNRTEGNSKNKLSDLHSSEILNKIFHSNEDDSLEGRNESLPDNYDKIQHKIEDLQILDKMAEFDGVEIWNCKYKHIPHSFLKIKKGSWTKSLSLPLMHPSQPKTINELPILPRLSKYKPSIDKLPPFMSYIKLLEKYFPSFSPTVDSIFQYNGLPYVFSHEEEYSSWHQQDSIGVLCYYIVYGDPDSTLTHKKVQRWAERNCDSLLGKTIKDLIKRQRERIKAKREVESKALVLYDLEQPFENIW